RRLKREMRTTLARARGGDVPRPKRRLARVLHGDKWLRFRRLLVRMVPCKRLSFGPSSRRRPVSNPVTPFRESGRRLAGSTRSCRIFPEKALQTRRIPMPEEFRRPPGPLAPPRPVLARDVARPEEERRPSTCERVYVRRAEALGKLRLRSSIVRS